MFSPYHKFHNCKKLERIISDFTNQNLIQDSVLNNYNKYHFTLIYKLSSSIYYLNQIETFCNTLNPSEIISDPTNCFRNINRNVDSYFYFTSSALDVLAREVLSYYGLLPNRDVYYSDINALLNNNSSQLRMKNITNNPRWIKNFKKYRNVSTHEILIINSLNLNISLHGQMNVRNIDFYLPDNPKIQPYTFNKNINAVIFCNDINKKILDHISKIYGILSIEMQSNNSLPL